MHLYYNTSDRLVFSHLRSLKGNQLSRMEKPNESAVYAQLSDSTDQTPDTTDPTLVKFDNQDAINGIDHDLKKSEGIIILEDGVYFVLAAGQVGRKSGSLLRFIDLWLRVNKKDIPNTTVRASAPASLFVGDTYVLIVQAVMPLKKGDVLNVVQSVNAEHEGLGLIVMKPENEPLIPSIIFTMYKI